MKTADPVLALLVRGRELIEGGWTQGVFARIPSGTWADVMHPEASAFCSTGALWRAQYERTPAITIEGHANVIVAVTWLGMVVGCSVPSWNDDPCRTKQEVVDAFNLAIQRKLSLLEMVDGCEEKSEGPQGRPEQDQVSGVSVTEPTGEEQIAELVAACEEAW